MATTDFFTDQTEQSRTKARVVSKYFDAWSRVVGPAARQRGTPIQYVDLFAGPGCYEDGSDSTPILVLKKAIANPNVRDLLVARFNDADQATAERLEATIKALPGVERLKHPPQVYNTPVDEQVADLFEGTRLVPTLTFLDPFGYKGLSMRLIRATLKDWGCDCVFFFNFNRVNAAIQNESVEGHITALFDAQDAEQLRQRVNGLCPHEREARVIEELASAVKQQPDRHVLHFAFRNDAGSRTSHYLVFATKHPRGYEIMKDIMARESSWADGGVPSYICSPAPRQRTLFEAAGDPLADLERTLLEDFAGQRLTAGEVCGRHGLGSRYTGRNYKDVLLRLEAAGRVTATPAAAERRANTMADHVLIEFPPRGG